MIGSLPPEPAVHHALPVERTGEPFVLRAGALLACAVIAALLASLPGALRESGEGSLAGNLERWVVLAAVATPPAALAVTVVQRARLGLKRLFGERSVPFVLAALWWSVLELAVLGVAGAVLSKTTHHRALGGVTFAAFALISGFVLALFARRLVELIESGGEALRSAAFGLAAMFMTSSLVVVAVRLTRVEDASSSSAFVDALGFAIATVLGSARILARSRLLALAGLPLLVLILVLGFILLWMDPLLRSVLAETAPIHSALLGLFGS